MFQRLKRWWRRRKPRKTTGGSFTHNSGTVKDFITITSGELTCGGTLTCCHCGWSWKSWGEPNHAMDCPVIVEEAAWIDRQKAPIVITDEGLEEKPWYLDRNFRWDEEEMSRCRTN